MSLFTVIHDAAISAKDHIVTLFSGIFHKDIEPALITFFHVLETNGGALLIKLALDTVIAAEAGTPFGVLTTTLIEAAKVQGLDVLRSSFVTAAKSALQVAQTSIEQGNS